MKSQDDKCPKTAMQSDATENHQYLVVLAASLWLERTYTKNLMLSQVDNSHAFNLNPPDQFDDFDAKRKVNNQNYLNGEKRLYHAIIEHLRAGELYEIQGKLQQNNCYEQLLLLNSTNPIFDNIEFREEISGTEDLFQQDLERQLCI